MSHKYKHIKKEYRKQRRKQFYAKINFYKKWQYKKFISKNIHPDVSSITNHIAFVIDGEVVEIIHCQPKMAAILMSNPDIVEIPKDKKPALGDRYENGLFISIENKK
jgi:hypothetical protein